MRLVEEGKLALDEDVNDYLKSWKVPENEYTKKEKVTVSQLMNHTAGIINFRDVTGYYGYKTTELLPTIQQMVWGGATVEDPGARHGENAGRGVELFERRDDDTAVAPHGS
jgi:CubicO group peptidase (beta-lactamase class C family)